MSRYTVVLPGSEKELQVTSAETLEEAALIIKDVEKVYACEVDICVFASAPLEVIHQPSVVVKEEGVWTRS